ncbi:hypothetical protein G7K_5352-t1 [Saitoella complicata NRRL Y-17804]|uniref:Potassium channel domain-containing protein n=1 Tax=Saitoella complicata (strain BCRC 22490 / CBS 7301 / JCM 7358 / NBRC 10748 / NRRL Y-17804) TaxID=698492 RepID=A0A0E9NN33_SAICN|nr:hypothetical protein G7K_5352-t1 [Saitoella complicata NRRL Y-17804]
MTDVTSSIPVQKATAGEFDPTIRREQHIDHHNEMLRAKAKERKLSSDPSTANSEQEHKAKRVALHAALQRKVEVIKDDTGFRSTLESLGQLAPVVGMLLGPMSILLAIPSLTQRWRARLINGDEVFQPDPGINIVLSSISLFFDVMGNACLLVRFIRGRVSTKIWGMMIKVCLICWSSKIIINIINYIIFSVRHPEVPGEIIYLQGYWVGICSCIVSFITVIFLILNQIFYWKTREEDSEDDRARMGIRAQMFMIQVTTFFIWMGFTALIFSKLEHWELTQGIYFMVVSVTTVGFGDVTPETTAGRIILFPLVLLGIALEGLIISSVNSIVQTRIRRRQAMNHARFRLARQEKREELKEEDAMSRVDSTFGFAHYKAEKTLRDELDELRHAEWKSRRMSNVWAFAGALPVFLLFWFVGAAIFQAVESSWTYWDSLYFCYVFFLTIGYGDFTPSSNAGRVVFIMYALLAVPIITTIVGLISTQFITITDVRLQKKRLAFTHHKTVSLRNLVAKEHEELKEITEDLSDLITRVMTNVEIMDSNFRALLMTKLTGEASRLMKAEQMRRKDFEGGLSVPSELTFTDEEDLAKVNTYRRAFGALIADMEFMHRMIQQKEDHMSELEAGEDVDEATMKETEEHMEEGRDVPENHGVRRKSDEEEVLGDDESDIEDEVDNEVDEEGGDKDDI